MRKLLKQFLLFAGFSFLVLATAVVGIVLWDLPPVSVRECMALGWEWDQFRTTRSGTDSERLARREEFAERSLQLAEQNPKSAVELAALMLADAWAADTSAGRQAGERLVARIASADFKTLSRACQGFGIFSPLSVDRAVPAVLARAKQELQHPKAAYLLARVCGSLGWASESNEPPDHFAEVADLIVTHCADSPDIYNFCEVLGNGLSSPRWAPQFESHLNRILQVNRNRWVRCTALMALAQIAQSYEERHPEAEERFQALLTEFDAQKINDQWQHVIPQHCENAKLQLEAMRFASVGKASPEIAGVDLSGQQMTLSEYRGKVVLLTFWATWCSPCMKLVRHEKELADRYADQPFAIVGVNADDDPAKAVKAEVEKSITWRSFRDKRGPGQVISDEWKALFPTVYLIDHKGIVRHRYSGSPNPDLINQSIQILIIEARK